MDKIKNINQIMEIVRSQVSGKSSGIKSQKTRSTQKSPTNKVEKISANELKKRISDKLKTSAANGQQSMQKSREIFLESVILWEFGDSLINDPAFPVMIEKIRITLDENRETSKNFDKLIQQLMQ